jgi:molybdate transport system substrate-binding protein
VVFAAASLKDALDAINADWQKSAGKHATISYAASSALAKQVESGAPADLFISADLDWMDYLDQKKQIAEGSRHNLLGNSLVLIAPADSTAKVDIAANFPLAKLLGGGKLAMADPAAVPAGKYGKAALTALGVWDSVSGNLAQAENVRVALAYVSRGEAPLGIVYKTDALSDKGVRIAGTFPENTHAPIVYPAALVKDAKPEAKGFLKFLSGPEATAIFEKDGFNVMAMAH